MPASTAGDWRTYVRGVRERGRDAAPAEVVSAVVLALARETGWEPPEDLRAHHAAPVPAVVDLAVPDSLVGPALLGRVLEAMLGDDVRRSLGAHYTPAPIASALTGVALEAATGGGAATPVVVDPACGGGAFLLAVADRLAGDEHEPGTIVRQALWGVDREPAAVATTEAALALWAWEHGDRSDAHPGPHLTVGDAISGETGGWVDRPVDGFDAVVGNPPFLGQLGRSTARTPEETAVLRGHLGDAVAAYTDASALFLLVGVRLLRPGGVLTLILPTSVLAARDAAPVRAAVLGVADLVGLWTADGALFDGAAVRVCAPVLRRDGDGTEPGPVARWHGADVAPRPPVARSTPAEPDASWSPYVADVHDVPDVEPATDGTLGDLARATAGFRSQYYGLVDHVVEAPADHALDSPRGELAPLVTVGLIDLGRCAWGERPARFGRRRWQRPAVDLGTLRTDDAALATWVEDLQVPKVLVATQTRVGEAAVDEAGSWVPSVPTIAVVAPPSRLWPIAAVVCSPVASALAVRRTAGTALSAQATKLSARQVLALPCPSDAVAWDTGASRLRAGDLSGFADAMAVAYGLPADHPVTGWWHDRRSPGRGSRR